MLTLLIIQWLLDASRACAVVHNMCCRWFVLLCFSVASWLQSDVHKCNTLFVYAVHSLSQMPVVSPRIPATPTHTPIRSQIVPDRPIHL